MTLSRFRRIYFYKGDVLVCEDKETREPIKRLDYTKKEAGNPCKVANETERMMLCNIKIFKRPEKYIKAEFVKQLDLGSPLRVWILKYNDLCSFYYMQLLDH